MPARDRTIVGSDRGSYKARIVGLSKQVNAQYRNSNKGAKGAGAGK